MVSAQSNMSHILTTMYGFSTVKHVVYTNYDVWFQHTHSNMSHILTTMYGFSTVKNVTYSNYDEISGVFTYVHVLTIGNY